MLKALTQNLTLGGSLPADMLAFLHHHGHPQTAAHCLRVAAEARQLAVRFGSSQAQADLAGWLHDISAAIPNAERLAAAHGLGLEVLPEEDAHPMLLHQRLSAKIAQDIFGVNDPAVLSAIACHTTLRPGAALLDKIVFVADKIAWDGTGEAPGVEMLQAALDCSLDEAALCYLERLVQRGAALPVLHPWAAQAHTELLAPRLLGRGEAVYLRERLCSDADFFLGWQTHGEWRHFDAPWEGLPDAPTPDQASAFRARFWQALTAPRPQPRTRAVIVSAAHQPLGWVTRYGEERFPEVSMVGIDLCEDAALNQGLGTQALRLWVDYLFDHSTIHKIGLDTWSFNPRMGRVAEKLGFTFEGAQRHMLQWQGQWLDLLHYGLLRQERP